MQFPFEFSVKARFILILIRNIASTLNWGVAHKISCVFEKKLAFHIYMQICLKH